MAILVNRKLTWTLYNMLNLGWISDIICQERVFWFLIFKMLSSELRELALKNYFKFIMKKSLFVIIFWISVESAKQKLKLIGNILLYIICLLLIHLCF